MGIQIFILVFILFVVFKVFLKYKKKLLTGKEFFVWIIFWALVAGAVLMPKATDVVAQKLGVERGADLLVYISLIVMFYIVFRIFSRMQKIERNITELVRQMAKKNENSDTRMNPDPAFREKMGDDPDKQKNPDLRIKLAGADAQVHSDINKKNDDINND